MKKAYKFVETEDIGFIVKSKKHNYTTTIHPRTFFPDGYAWDGCSPKFNFIDLTFGTPDGKAIKHTLMDYINLEGYPCRHRPITYYASLLHDYLYQYKEIGSYSRKDADNLFYQALKINKFKLAWLYYIAVRIFGRFYGEWPNKTFENFKLIEICID